MFVDPAVVKIKVEREYQEFRQLRESFLARGVWLLDYSFPFFQFAFVSKNLKPYPIVPFGASFDFSDYDVLPPSIKIIDPLTGRSQSYGDLAGVPFLVQRPTEQPSRIVQGWGDADPNPFICLQGVREYHDNPGHAGDPWLLYRGAGYGKLCRLLDLLARHGSEPVVALQVSFNIAINKALTVGAGA